MNLNGRPVPFLLRSLSNHTGTQPPILLALHDNLTIPPLTVGKARFNVSSQGHGGLTSIESTLKSKEFWRLGLGVGRNDSQGVVGWVMSGLSRDEKLFWEGEGVRGIVREVQGLLGKTKDGRPMDMAGGKSKKKKNQVEVVNPGPPGR
jgi:peptidyl-tRNA hydrolase